MSDRKTLGNLSEESVFRFNTLKAELSHQIGKRLLGDEVLQFLMIVSGEVRNKGHKDIIERAIEQMGWNADGENSEN